ncbi:MAG: outer membrane efflux protein [Puniceicoccaceae bacterium 5H]|nr:MAG: outer membrane efflux protein [Puniceicoccaceae bacterium 5H]
MKRLTIFLVLGLLSGAWSPASAQSNAPALPSDLRLGQALQLALACSPELERQRARIEEQTGYVVEARAARLPSLVASSDYHVRAPESVESVGGFITPQNQSWNVALSIDYVVYAGGRIRAGIRADEAARQAAEASYRAAVQDVLYGVEKAYFNALFTRDAWQIEAEAVDLLQGQLELAQSRWESGRGSHFEELQAQVALQNEEPGLRRARQRFASALEALRVRIGVEVAPDQDLTDETLLTSWPDVEAVPPLESALAQALEERPELDAAYQQLQAAQARRKAANAGQRPEVHANGGYQVFNRQYSGGFDDTLDGAYAGVSLSWNLWDNRATAGRKMAAQAVVHQTQAAEAQLHLDIQQDVRDSYYRHEAAQAVLDSSTTTITLARTALDLAQERFKAGSSSQLDVLQSQLDLTRARLQQAQAQYDLQAATADLQHAMGQPLLGPAD